MRQAIGPALAMVLCACEGERRAEDPPAVATTEPRRNASESVMRPDVLAEAEPVPPPPPPAPMPTTATVPFPERGFTLDDGARGILDALLTPERLAGTSRVTVSGHSDSRGGDRENKAASLRRAEAVRDHLVGRGIAEGRIDLVALGETRPVAPNALLDGSDDPVGRARNRRVEVEFAPAAPVVAAGRTTAQPAAK